MESEFYTPNQLHISYQSGMEGKRGSFTIPRWLPLLAALVFVFFLVSTVIFYVNLGGQGRVESRLQALQKENDALRNKLDFYTVTVDSIYGMLDSLKLKAAPEGEAYPSLGAEAAKPSFDPRLEQKMDNLEYKLAYILNSLSPALDAPLASLSELPSGDLPSDTTPSIYPTFGRISDGWGLRIHPIHNEIEMHEGIDIANQMGTPIYSTASGTVSRVDFDSGYGKRIIINHAGVYETVYAHLYSYLVQQGDVVSKGQIIGLMGTTGVSTGPHLHYEVRTAAGKVNPSAYLNRIDDALVASN